MLFDQPSSVVPSSFPTPPATLLFDFSRKPNDNGRNIIVHLGIQNTPENTHGGEICQVIASQSSESRVNDSMIHSIDPQDG